MFILFALVLMRVTGGIAMNPVLGRTNFPNVAKGALIFMLSVLVYAGTDGTLAQEPAGMLDFGVMLIKEFMVGFVMGYSMELSFAIIRFGSAIIDHTMGLSMAQTYDPQYGSQMTITSNLYYAFLVTMFLALDGHVRLLSILFTSARLIPFGEVTVRPELSEFMLEVFRNSIAMGLQFAFPIIAMELVAEAAIGILMRVIPQINVFAVNFQMKIIVGMMLLVFLFNPMSAQLYTIIDDMLANIENALVMLITGV